MIKNNIESIRKGKNILINDLTENIFTRASYDNFKRGKHDIKFNNFFLLTEKLHLLADEMELILPENSTIQFKHKLDKLRKLTVLNDVEGMRKLKEEVMSEKYFFSAHLAELIELRIMRTTQSSNLSKTNSPLISYLIKTEQWTRYEIILFTGSMFAFNDEVIDLLLNRVFKNILSSESVQAYGDERFRILLNAYILFFERKNLILIKKWGNFLELYELNPVFFYEKSFQRLFLLFIEYIMVKNYSALETAYEISNSLKVINCEEHSEIFQKMCKFIDNTY